MIEHKMKIQSDQRGKISSGKKNPVNGLPMKLDYFDVSDFAELTQVYGDKPKQLIVVLPSDNPADFLQDSYTLYGGKPGKDATKIRTCDGNNCVHRIDENVGGESFKAGEISDCVCKVLGLFDTEDKELKKKACRYRAYFKAFVADKSGRVITPMPISFETGSINSGSNIGSTVAQMQFITSSMTGGKSMIAFLPFIITVKMVSSSKKANLTFPIWHLYPVGSMAQIRNRLLEVAKRFGGGDSLIKEIQGRAEVSDRNLIAESSVGVDDIDQRPVVDEPMVDDEAPPEDSTPSATPMSDLFLKR